MDIIIERGILMCKICKNNKYNQKIIEVIKKIMLIILLLLFLIGMMLCENNRKIIGFIIDYFKGDIIIELSDMAVFLQVVPIVTVSFFSYRISKMAFQKSDKDKKRKLKSKYESKKELFTIKIIEMKSLYLNLNHNLNRNARNDIDSSLKKLDEAVYEFERLHSEVLTCRFEYEDMNDLDHFDKETMEVISLLLYKVKYSKEYVKLAIINKRDMRAIIEDINNTVEELEKMPI
ncbi:MAG: hypothetical protein N4A40_09375 [Tissierellales bacterium]|nr:hypothetical protein [Tissierellales bacterium]